MTAIDPLPGQFRATANVMRNDARAWRACLWVLIPAFLIFPSFAWIALDTTAWGGDQSLYGFATLELFRAAIHAPTEWLHRFLDVYPWKANGLIWLGQLFVPLAYLTSSHDQALLLTVGVLQLATLIVIYRALMDETSSAFVVPLSACLVIASAPLFVSLGQHYLVETMQTLSVAWFIALMSLAPKLSRPLLFAQLLAATAFAMAAKVSQPIFCIWPGLVAFFFLFRSRYGTVLDVSSRRYTFASFALGVPLAVATVAWYVHNFAQVMQLAYQGTYGPGVSTFWGKNDTYVNTVIYWLSLARTGLFLSGVGDLTLWIVASAVLSFSVKRDKHPKHFTICATVAALQIVTVVLVFSLSPTRQLRYLLPVLPYVAVLLSWSLAQLDHWAITRVTLAAFAVQLVLAHGQALKIGPVLVPGVRQFDRKAHSGAVMASIVARTCGPAGAGTSWNILAIDPGIPALGGDWLAPDPANYAVAKNQLREGGTLPCHYAYIGDSFFGASVPIAWSGALAHQVRYIITTDPARYPPPVLAFNQTLNQENFPILLRAIQTSGQFRQEPPLQEDHGVLIFRRMTPAE